MAGVSIRLGLNASLKEGGTTKIHLDSATEHKSQVICFKRSSKQSAKSLHFSEPALLLVYGGRQIRNRWFQGSAGSALEPTDLQALPGLCNK